MKTTKNIFSSFSRLLAVACLLAFALCGGSAYCQDYSSSNKKAIKLVEKAGAALQQGNGAEAERCLKQALDEDAAFLEAHLMLAEWLVDSKRASEAAQHYRYVVEHDEAFFPLAWLELGRIGLADGNYQQAVSDFESFLKIDKKHRDRREEAQHGVETARFRSEAMANPVPFNPVNMGAAVNSKDDEYLPALTVDGETLVFTRRFPRTPRSTADTKEEEDIYVSRKVGGTWGKAVRMPEPLNSFDNEGAECISQDGRIMFFTACNRKDGGGRCDLYMCINKGGEWGKPRNLGPAVNSGAWEGQPSFSIDGKTLYFVSNRKGGYGGMDIWKSTFGEGGWSEPVNLGPEVNTAGNEMSPFIHYDDRTLYFASDGHVGMGGMDIFVTRRTADGGWSNAENIGWPLNTPGDESNLIVSADAHTAIYSSDRPGGLGRQDLWTFEMPEKGRPTVAVCFKGRVTDARSGASVGADIKVVSLKDGAVVANTSSDAKNGDYIVSLPSGEEYAFLVSAKGYLFHSQNVVEKAGDEWSPTVVDIGLKPIVKGESIALRNVFFETGRYVLLPQSEYELDKVVELLQQNKSLKVELGGHTDNVGQPQANQKLSEQRAKAVYEYLVKKGVDASRLIYKGYGETKPVAGNDTEEGRAANRRTEMKILEG